MFRLVPKHHQGDKYKGIYAYVDSNITEHDESPSTQNVKGEAVPLQAWNGPEGSRKLRFPDFLTTA
jgi:hypothetical protein